jgi:protoheme IX farnesyltransferase
MLPVVAPQREWTTAILSYTATLFVLSLVPLWFGMGWIYGVFAAAGGGWFLWKSWRLHRAPSRKTAIANFLASLVQLLLLVSGIFLSALVE